MKRTLFALSAAACAAAMANVELGTPFGDNMVLQRGRPVPVWGTADAGEKVTVSFAGQVKSTTAGADGKWQVALDAMDASKEGRTLAARGKNASEARNVLVGEVWFASGQSNMECPIWGDNPRYRDGKGAMMIQSTVRPFIRWAKNPRVPSATPRAIPRSPWNTYTPQSFAAFKGMYLSAVAYYYALELYGALDVPIGIVDSSWGGTCIDTWTPPCGYENHPELADVVARFPKKGGRIHCQNPTALWNGMVDSWAPMAMRGFIWYQGCSNNGEARRYCSKMHALYDGWSKAFKNPDLKLYFVELAPFKASWFELQRSQMKFAAEQKNAAIAATADAGNFHDIHPNDKEIVAKRLALHALKRDYGFENVRDDSPVLKSWKIEGDTFVLTFDGAKGWYVYSPDYSKRPNFEIAGKDGKFVPAILQGVDGNGNVKGTDLRVRADGVKEPLRLRYLAKAPYVGTLYSDAALPLGPFDVDARTNKFTRIGAPVKMGEAEKIPELSGYRKIGAIDVPIAANFSAKPPQLAAASGFGRVAYLFELERLDGTVDWAMTSFNAFSQDVDDLGVPCRPGKVFQTKVVSLTSRSNISGVPCVTDYDGGSIEFWPSNYGTAAVLAGVGGNPKIYDVNDQPNGNGIGYGSMQVHDWKGGTTIWALNNFNTLSPCDVGIGNNEMSEHPDWTFMANAPMYRSRRISVFVK